MPPSAFDGQPLVDGPESARLIGAARMAGLLAIDLDRSYNLPLIVYRDGQQAAAERLGRRLVVAMREAVAADDGHDDPAGRAITALVAFVGLISQGAQPTPAAYRQAISDLVDAATPYTRGEFAWDEQDRAMVLKNAQRAWIRAWVDTRGVM